MKKFLKLVLLFAFPIFIMGGVMELLLQHIPNEYQLKSNYLNQNKKSIKTLLVGDSHILYGINPEYLTEKAINYGHVSQTLNIDYDIIHQYINQLDHLETVVIRLSYATLFEQLKLSNEGWRIKNYVIYTGIDLDAKLKHHFEIFSVKLKYNLKRIYNFYILNKSPEFVNASGWGVDIDNKYIEDRETLGMRIAKKHTASTDDLFGSNVKILEKIIHECLEKDVKVVLITMPAYSSYVDNLDKVQLEQTITIGTLMEEHNLNCTYYNFLNDKRFDKQDFIDVDHLNSQGAEKFSKLLDSILTQ